MHTSNNQPCQTRPVKAKKTLLHFWKSGLNLALKEVLASKFQPLPGVSVLRSCVVSPPLSDGGQHLAQGLLGASVVKARVWWWSEL